jgi:excisionase family DNA binding protein
MTPDPTPLYGTSPGTSHVPAPPAEGPPPARAVSVGEAAAALGVSANTIRRWIKTGELRADRVVRPQGEAWRVYLPRHVPAGTSREVPPGTSQHVPPAPPIGTSLASPDVQRAEALAAYGAALLAPVLATVERLEAVNRDQAETIGQLRAQLAAAELLPSSNSPRPWWRFWDRS